MATESHHCVVRIALAKLGLVPRGAGMNGMPLRNSWAAARKTFLMLALSYW